jgi:hypothetical protein
LNVRSFAKVTEELVRRHLPPSEIKDRLIYQIIVVAAHLKRCPAKIVFGIIRFGPYKFLYGQGLII